MIEYMMCYKLMSLIVALMVATISWTNMDGTPAYNRKDKLCYCCGFDNLAKMSG